MTALGAAVDASRRRGARGRSAASVAIALLLAGCSGHQAPRDESDPHCPGRTVVHALDAATGTERWSRTVPGSLDHVPVPGGGQVVLEGCGVRTLDERTGVTTGAAPGLDLLDVAGVWQRGVVGSLDGQVVAQPLPTTSPGGSTLTDARYPTVVAIAGDLLVVGTEGRLEAYDAHRPWPSRWQTALAGTGPLPRGLVVDDRLVVLTGDGSLLALSLADGRPAWRALPDAPSLGYASLLAAGADGVVATVHDEARPHADALVGVSLRDGREMWRRSVAVASEVGTGRIGQGSQPPVGVVDGAALLEGVEHQVATAVDLATGRTRWTAPVRAVVASGGSPVGLDPAGLIVGLDPASGQVRWQARTGDVLAPVDAGAVVVLDPPTVAYRGD